MRLLPEPEDAALAVAVRGDGLEGGLQGFADGVELVVPGDLLGEGFAVVLEDDEGADEVEEAPGVEDALDGDVEGGGREQLVAVDRLPGGEALAGGGEGADLGLGAVGDDQQLAEVEEAGDLGLVGLELLPGGVDGGLGVLRVLKLEEGEREAADEEDDVGPALDVGAANALDDGELVDREPVVVGGVVEVDQVDQLAARLAVPHHVDGDALDEELVERGFGLDPMVVCLALASRVDQRAAGGTQKMPSAVYSSLSAGSTPWSGWASSSAWWASKASEMYLRKMRPRTTCLYSAASMWPRSLSAAAQSLALSWLVRPEATGKALCLGLLGGGSVAQGGVIIVEEGPLGKGVLRGAVVCEPLTRSESQQAAPDGRGRRWLGRGGFYSPQVRSRTRAISPRQIRYLERT